MRHLISSVFALPLLLGASAALAEGAASPAAPTSAEDIVQFYAKTVDLGATRGLCVGTEEQCAAKKVAEAPAPTGLDTLVNFDLDSADLTPSARSQLGKFAEALKDNRLRSHSFTVEGYTDASGSAQYNMSLSERRARSVAAFLLASGVEPGRIKAEGKGEDSPRVSDPFDPGNRRVELKIDLR